MVGGAGAVVAGAAGDGDDVVGAGVVVVVFTGMLMGRP
jgi:hypothetical protein